MLRKLILSIVAALPLLSVAEIITLDGMTYELHNNYYEPTATATYDGISANVVVHDIISYNGETYKVNIYEHDTFKGQAKLTSVEFDVAGMVELFSFRGCTNLQYVKFPDEKVKVREEQYYDCPKLVLTEILPGIEQVEPRGFGLSEPRMMGAIDLSALPNRIYGFDSPGYKMFEGRLYTDITVSANCELRNFDTCETERITLIDCGIGMGDNIFNSYEKLKTLKIIGSPSDINLTALPELSTLDMSGMTGWKSDKEAGVWISQCPKITSLSIPPFYGPIHLFNLDNLTTLYGCENASAAYIFDCKSIESLSFPAVEYFQCRGNSALKEVYVGDQLKEINTDELFSGCKNLKDFIYGGSLEQWLAIERRIDDSDSKNAMFRYIENFWYGHGNAKMVTLTELNPHNIGNATCIPRGAFTAYAGLAKVSLPAQVTRICNSAFAYCTGLKEVDINVERIEQFAFLNAKNITSLTFGTNLNYIGPAFSAFTENPTVNYKGTPLQWMKIQTTSVAYEDCDDPESEHGIAVVGSPTLTYANMLFNGEPCTKLVVKDMDYVNNSMSRNGDLKAVVFDCSSGIFPEISNGAFWNCHKLESIEYIRPAGRKSGNGFVVGEEAFYWTNLSRIDILDDIKTIGAGALYNTPWMKEQPADETVYLNTEHGLTAYEYNGVFTENTHLTFKEGTKAINDKFLYYAAADKKSENVTSVSFPTGLTYIGNAAFDGAKISGDIIIPSTVNYMGWSGDAWLNLDKISFEDSDEPLPVYFHANKINLAYIGRNKVCIYSDDCKRVAVGPKVSEIEVTLPGTEDITMLAATPPVCSLYQPCYPGTTIPSGEPYYRAIQFIDVSTCVLHVPENSVDAYRSAECWKDFANIIGDAKLDSGMLQASVSEDDAEQAHYDLSGRRINSNAKGFHIVKYSDGSSRKLYVK